MGFDPFLSRTVRPLAAPRRNFFVAKMTTTMSRRKRGFSQRSLRPSLYTSPRQRQEPFYVLFFKVGSTILVLSAVFYLVVNVTLLSHQNDGIIPYREHLLVKHNDVSKEKKDDNKVMILPTFTLSAKSEFDAFGIAQTHFSNVSAIDAPKEVVQFLQAAKQLRNDFSERYGGEISARALLERSLLVLQNHNDDSQSAMALRIDHARRESGVLHMAFGGSATVAGYGNFFHQSFPFIMETMLKDPLELLGLTLQVRNGAVEHTSLLPYTWCRSNFLGNHVDVASMDFGNVPLQQLETVIRNMLGSQDEEEGAPPILVFRDSLQATERLSLLQRYVSSADLLQISFNISHVSRNSYVDAGALLEPIIVDVHAAFAPFQNVKEEILPSGFQQWKEFGAPPGAPGKVRQNLSLRQHELLGWILAMHVLGAAELVVKSVLDSSFFAASQQSSLQMVLPRPQSNKRMKTTKWTSLLYGTPKDASYKEWTSPSTECRTAFDPVVSGSLASAIKGGTASEDVDLLHPKGAMYFLQGWVLDLEASERREKQLMKQWDNLGFQDYMKAYYGVPASGQLSLFLPARKYNGQQSAREVFKNLVVCESNAKSNGNGCNLERDVTFTVGGVEASSVQWIADEAVAYHSKRLCVLVDIPENAALVSEQEAKQAVEERMQMKPKEREEDRRSLQESTPTMGLVLEIEVTNSRVTWHSGACSVAHVIWEYPSTVR